MNYRLAQFLILGFYIIDLAKSTDTVNPTPAHKIVCHFCKGDNCTQINSHENIVTCNRHTHLCWAGYVNQRPYRACANRYCTPSTISLDDDIRNELCCRSNLCNSIPLPFLSETHGVSTKRSTPSSAPPSTAPPAPAVTTPKNSPPAHEIYIVNEVVNDEHVFSSSGDVQENHDDDLLVNKGGAKGKHSWDDTITWHRVSYGTGFGNRIVSMSKLIILVMPIFIALLF